MSNLNTLKSKLFELMKRNKDGSFSTQSNRKRIVLKIAKDLNNLGFKFSDPKSLKPKHIFALLEQWGNEDIATSTIKNRMSHIRWWAEKVNKSSIVMRENSAYGIEKRIYITNISKGKLLDSQKLELVTCDFVKASLVMQKEFGLRREEAIKFNHSVAVKGDNIVLKGTWCKGGKSRTIPIETDSQRNILDKVRSLAGTGSLIPSYKSYYQQLKSYEYQTSLVSLNKMHGLRHEFAQNQYRRITGWECPIKGGIKYNEMTDVQKKIDRGARQELSRLLGHERPQITSVYIGS